MRVRAVHRLGHHLDSSSTGARTVKMALQACRIKIRFMCATVHDAVYITPEAYPWQANMHYWIVTGLYSAMRAQELTEQELRVKCRGKLRKMAARIWSGEQITPPRRQIEKLYVPASTERV